MKDFQDTVRERLMLGPNGNPQARNLFEVIAQLQHAEGVHFQLR